MNEGLYRNGELLQLRMMETELRREEHWQARVQPEARRQKKRSFLRRNGR